MNIKFKVFLIVDGAIAIVIIYHTFLTPQTPLFSPEVRRAFDGQLQSMSNAIPFKYNILSTTYISTPSGWCVVITPPLEMNLQPTNKLSMMDHFFTMIEGDRPSGIRFENNAIDRKRWADMGCGKW
jgi:hypothetical protein